MSPYPKSITRWAEQVNSHLPHLSRPQAWVLALWSYAVQTLQCCGQSQVSYFLAQLLEQKPNTLRQRLREWTWDKAAKQGAQRQEVDVAACFAPLLAWVLSGWPTGERRLALALDATSLKQNVVVLTVSVLYGGGAIPIAWQVVPAAQPGAWRPYWLALLAHLNGLVPAEWQVLVLADRGLYAAWLFRAIQAQHWHPFLRINTGGQCRPAGASEFQPLASLLPPMGQTWSGPVVCFKTARLTSTLLIHRDDHHQDPWLILTDLPPDQASIAWYRLRAWIEAQFKDFKSGGWQWDHTRMTDPDRIARVWLVLAVAALYALSLGSQMEAAQPPSERAALPPAHIAHRTATSRPQPRRLSLVMQGWLAFLVRLIRQQALPTVQFHLPDHWPDQPAEYLPL
jgi:hypothetical protein